VLHAKLWVMARLDRGFCREPITGAKVGRIQVRRSEDRGHLDPFHFRNPKPVLAVPEVPHVDSIHVHGHHGGASRFVAKPGRPVVDPSPCG